MSKFSNKLVALPQTSQVGQSSNGPLLLIVLDGFGVGKKDNGDCVHLANPPHINEMINQAQKRQLYCELKAHGTAVGLPSDEDMGNSEVGHNALGCGQLVAQGAKLVNIAIENGSMFDSANFNKILKDASSDISKTVHFVGLLSDGNVHSHIDQLIKLVENMASRGVCKVRLHAVTDGRDVSSMSAMIYVSRMEEVFAKINASAGYDYKFASGGGRMYCLMDRYEADWNIVKRGWDAMVHGTVDPAIVKECAQGWTGRFRSFTEAVEEARRMFPKMIDQDYPPWVIVDEQEKPVGQVQDGDVVICFNYRGDRSIEISRAFENVEPDFDAKCFDRKSVPKVDYYGMLIYDNEIQMPRKSLCPNPVIKNVLGEYLLGAGITNYACSESHKIGHVTYFFSGNRSGYLDDSLELYEEIKSEPNDHITTNPAMRAREIGDKTVAALESGKWKFLRINLANGDMVGHCGHIPPTIEAIKVLDEVVHRLVELNEKLGGITVITADHGNCEEMLDKKGQPKTSHTLNVVPFIIVDPHAKYVVDTSKADADPEPAGLTNVAASIVNLFGYEKPATYRESLIRFL
jgi:2,3-bisphosphoglycerate-independent phosphoglycerate mutase